MQGGRGGEKDGSELAFAREEKEKIMTELAQEERERKERLYLVRSANGQEHKENAA